MEMADWLSLYPQSPPLVAAIFSRKNAPFFHHILNIHFQSPRPRTKILGLFLNLFRPHPFLCGHTVSSFSNLCRAKLISGPRGNPVPSSIMCRQDPRERPAAPSHTSPSTAERVGSKPTPRGRCGERRREPKLPPVLLSVVSPQGAAFAIRLSITLMATSVAVFPFSRKRGVLMADTQSRKYQLTISSPARGCPISGRTVFQYFSAERRR